MSSPAGLKSSAGQAFRTTFLQLFTRLLATRYLLTTRCFHSLSVPCSLCASRTC